METVMQWASKCDAFTPKRLELLSRMNDLCEKLEFMEWYDLSKDEMIQLFSRPRCVINKRVKIFCMHLMCELINVEHEVCKHTLKWVHLFGRGNLSDMMLMFKGAHIIMRDMMEEDPCSKVGIALNKAMIDGGIMMPRIWYV